MAIEVFFSFLVVFAVMTVAVYNLDNYRRPLGFDYHDVLNVNVASLPEMAANVDGAPVSATEETRRLLREVRGLDAVEGVAGMAVPAFDLTGMSDVVEHQGRRIDSFNNEVTDDFAQVMGVEVTQGRWFEPADDALSYEPVLINERLKRDLFGAEDPLGENIAPKPDEHSMAHGGGKAPPGAPRGRRLHRLPRGRRAVRPRAVLLPAQPHRGPRRQALLQPRGARSAGNPGCVRGEPHGPAACGLPWAHLPGGSPGEDAPLDDEAEARADALRGPDRGLHADHGGPRHGGRPLAERRAPTARDRPPARPGRHRPGRLPPGAGRAARGRRPPACCWARPWPCRSRCWASSAG